MADIKIIIQTTPEGPTFLLRHDAYRPGEAQELIADILSLANSVSTGKRYVVFGVEAVPGSTERRVRGIEDVPNTQMWQHLVREYVEPDIKIECRTETLDGRKVGVLIVPPCAHAPYMVKRTLGSLERGASFVRRDTKRDRLVREDLELLYARRYDTATRFAGLQVGFDGDKPRQTLELRRQDDSALPSYAATSKLRELIDARNYADKLAANGDSGIVRMVHVRLYGADVPYESRTLRELESELEQVRQEYREQDRIARYERDAMRVNLAILNDSAEPLEDAALIVHFPITRGFEVLAGPDDPVSSSHVHGKRENAALSIARTLGRIEPGDRVVAFGEPLRIVLTAPCRHSLLPVRYELRAANLPSSMQGKLKLKVA